VGSLWFPDFADEYSLDVGRLKMEWKLDGNDGEDFRKANDIELVMGAEDAFDYGFEEGAEAQAKKLVEWGMGICQNKEHHGLGNCRFDCMECFKSLRKEVGVE
jgi:hypothetical protein